MSKNCMQCLIASDVFGRTSALEEMASKLSGTVEIVDPYSSKHMDFVNEADAYRYFVSEVGLDNYSARLNRVAGSFSGQLGLIGFSVGASAIWNIAAQEKLSHISSAMCFYGSQIRHERHLSPLFPIRLVHPAAELHFSVPELIDDLAGIGNVRSIRTPFYHGFMNTHSENFDQAGYDQFIRVLQSMANKE